MDFDLFSCTFENLNSLKFNELQKLSSKYRVNKRWAKKREIIDKLLSLRDEEIQKKSMIPDNGEKNISSKDNEQWIDGNEAFSFAAPNKSSNNDEIDRRLTYNVSHPTEEVDRRLTFNVVKNEGSQKITRDVNIEIFDNIDRRLTYNADEMKEIQRSLKSTKETCNKDKDTNNVPVSDTIQELTNYHDTIKTVENSSQPDKQVSPPSEQSNLNNVENFEKKENTMMTDTSHKHVEKSAGLKSGKVKMLTVPYSRIPAQSRRSVVKVKESDPAKMKLNEKLPAASKLMKTRFDTTKTPHTLQKLNPSITNKVTSTAKPLLHHSNSLSASKPNLLNPSMKMELSTLDTKRRILPRRKSKTEDNVLVTNLKSSRNLKFFSPTESNLKNHKRLSDSNRLNLDTHLKSRIPKARDLVETQKPLTAKKMPDFTKIHQRQFEQMDSLLDYKRKKEERAKKLFGMPQPGIPVRINKGNVSTTLFQFKSTHEKENQLNETKEATKKPNEVDVKQPNRKDLMNREGYKSNIVKNVKEQNRKHLNGVRTNKRFELQMKFRKL